MTAVSPFPFPVSPSTRSWVVLVDSAGRPGAANMAVDEMLLHHVAQDPHAPAYLRLYRFSPPCLSFGRNEPALARYHRTEIERLGLDVVRRPTGGRAVWHDQEVTYAVVAREEHLGCLRDSYHEIHRRLARALRTLGVEAVLAPASRRTASLSAGACFAQPVGGEVLVAGAKVVGSAQVRQGSAFLQHGSILLAGSQGVVARVSRGASPASSATSVSTVLGRRVDFQEVVNGIVATWLEPDESWLADELTALPPSRPTAFTSPAWTWRR